jgi:xanthine dehydrogenase/oxidase
VADPPAGACTAPVNHGQALAAGAEAALTAPLSAAEPIFPPELRRLAATSADTSPPTSYAIPGSLATWYRPSCLRDLLALKKQLGDEAKIVAGNSEVGIELKFKHAGYRHLVSVSGIAELKELALKPSDEAVLGAGAALSDVEAFLAALYCNAASSPQPLPAHATRGARAVCNQLRWFAGRQIRNVATLGGNVATASPISDLNPLWAALGARFVIEGEGTGRREVPAREFFLGYRQTAMQPHEVLVAVVMPLTREHEYACEFKQSPRRDDDIAIVNAGMRVRLAPPPSADGAAGGNDNSNEDASWTVAEASIVYGGVAPRTLCAEGAERALVGQPWTRATLERALAALREEDVRVPPTAPGGRGEYRNSLSASFLFKFFARVSAELQRETAAEGEAAPALPRFKAPLPPRELASAAQEYSRPPVRGVQFFAPPRAGQTVGQAPRHLSADLQVSGEAAYLDDAPLPPNALHAALVVAERPHAELLSVDPSAALALPGVAGYFDYKDVPGSNLIGPVKKDEQVFAQGKVTCVGQVIGVVCAATEPLARRAARLVKVEYGADLPAALTVDDAVAMGSYYEEYYEQGTRGKMGTGDVEAAFAAAEKEKAADAGAAAPCPSSPPLLIVEGGLRMGGQEHFYLEPQGCLVVPSEADEYHLLSSTQAPTKHQVAVSSVLGVPMHKIVSKAKRLGGGFGGKETRGIFLHAAVAVAAYHLKRPVKCVLDRDEDMQMTGTRHPAVVKWKAVVEKGTGRVVAASSDYWLNVGNSWDLSHSVADRCLLHADGGYKIPVLQLRAHMCRTNISSNTAFRGFGGPQGLMGAQALVEHAARCSGNSAAQGAGGAWRVIERMLYQPEGEVTHYGMKLSACNVRACWDRATNALAGGMERRGESVAAFNARNRWRKRGLAAMPTHFGISFTTKFLNQAGALVHIYTDGTVLVTHGGVEMGQGLHTKVAQVAAQALGCPLASVFIAETSTDKVPNSSPTAASASSDMYGAAVLNACEQLNARLKPFRERLSGNGGGDGNASSSSVLPVSDLAPLARLAYSERVDLSAHGFYATPDITGADGDRPFNYFVYGAAVCEVELDVLTGDWQLLRADVAMDVGNPINPAVDVGQVEGAFVQGVGWSCLEELVWGDKAHPWVRPGHLFTKGPGTYKIPTANDAPVDFRVELLQGQADPKRALHSSKAVGEPPFHLGATAFFALKEAVYAAREEEGGPGAGWFQLDLPATPERLRMACADELMAPYVPEGQRGSFKPLQSV